jgi:hypothetical protein
MMHTILTSLLFKNALANKVIIVYMHIFDVVMLCVVEFLWSTFSSCMDGIKNHR